MTTPTKHEGEDHEHVEVVTTTTVVGAPHFYLPGADESPFHVYHHPMMMMQQQEQQQQQHRPDLQAGEESFADSAEENLEENERDAKNHKTSNHNNMMMINTNIQNRNDQAKEGDGAWWQMHPLTALKHVLSMALTLFCIVVVSDAIFTKQTVATGEKNVHPILAYIVFWGLILWLALMEGALNCMVGLKPIDKTLYQHSHVRTFQCTSLAHRGDNLERFIVGRQYLDLTCVFMTNLMVSTVDHASVLGLPALVNEIFLDSGLAVILVTIIFGQLVTQINAAHSMLDYMNHTMLLIITYVALAVEASGLLHAVYLVQIFFSKISGKPIESNEPTQTVWQRVAFWLRMAMSVTILLLAFVVCFAALFQNSTTMWEGVPPIASVVLLVTLIGITGMIDGLQIAFFAVAHLPKEQIEQNASAKYNCDLIFHQSSTNLQAFLVGRQIFQTVVMFLIARILTVDMKDGQGNLFGVSSGLQAFFETGVLGALLSTIVASLSWRVLASSFPMVFLANPLSTVIIKVCLWVEWTGICYSSWTLSKIHYRIARFQDDNVYIGAATHNASDVHKTKLPSPSCSTEASDDMAQDLDVESGSSSSSTISSSSSPAPDTEVAATSTIEATNNNKTNNNKDPTVE
ncbi:hypothetical protein ACA910_018363 [Epithemia clementina (nom. ined.)]